MFHNDDNGSFIYDFFNKYIFPILTCPEVAQLKRYPCLHQIMTRKSQNAPQEDQKTMRMPANTRKNANSKSKFKILNQSIFTNYNFV